MTENDLPSLGIGTWAWGDDAGWGSVAREDILSAFRTATVNGINLFDTAEVYGGGRSEEFLGECLRACPGRVMVATKFAPFRHRLLALNLRRALRESLRRLGISKIDLYQIHWHSRWVSIERWMSAMADAADDGLVDHIGVSNYSADQMRRAADALARRNYSLASNQVEYNLLCRLPEKNGVLSACRDLGTTLIAYSPLARGILSGKYSAGNLPAGIHRRRYTAGRIMASEPLVRLLTEIGQEHGGKTGSQVALNWLVNKNVVPIPGAKNAQQAAEHADALNWSLTVSQMEALDHLSETMQN